MSKAASIYLLRISDLWICYSLVENILGISVRQGQYSQKYIWFYSGLSLSCLGRLRLRGVALQTENY
jgi:hypothetical protein